MLYACAVCQGMFGYWSVVALVPTSATTDQYPNISWQAFLHSEYLSLGGVWERLRFVTEFRAHCHSTHRSGLSRLSPPLVSRALLLQKDEVCPAPGSVGVVISSALGPGESWSVRRFMVRHMSGGPSGAWSWRFEVHSALDSGGSCPFYTGSCSFLHWVLGGHVHPTLAPEKSRVSFCTGFWGAMSILHWLLNSVVVHPALNSGGWCTSYTGTRKKSKSILHWVMGVTSIPQYLLKRVVVHFTLGLGGSCTSYTGSWKESWSILCLVLRSRGLFYAGSWGGDDLSYTHSWGIMVHPVLGPGDRGPFHAWFWGGESGPTLHWLLGGHSPSLLDSGKNSGSLYTGFWGVLSILHWLLKRIVVHPVLGSKKSWHILHRVRGSRGPTHAGA